MSSRVVAIVDDPGLSPLERLAAALERIGAWDSLAGAAAQTRIDAGDLPIVILPELSGFAVGSPVSTDSKLVEHLIDLLHNAGYVHVTVAGSSDSSALWAGNRDVLALADLLGYSFITPSGRDYDLADLSQDLSDGGFARGDVLHGTDVSQTWLEAGFRIIFAKNRSDDADGYALCLDTLLGALPLIDKDYHYRLACDAGDVVAELLRHTPVHLALIDGVVSCHGSGGSRAPNPIVTNSVIASSDVWVADHVGALAMGLDPALSRLARHSPLAAGSLQGVTFHGELRAYEGWRTPHPVLLDATRRRNASPTFSRLVRPWLQVLDSDLFPLTSPLDARMNSFLAPLFSHVDDDPVAFAVLVFVSHALANMQRTLDEYRTLYAKDDLRQIQVPLALDLCRFSPADYHAIAPELVALERLLTHAPVQADGLCWREIDGAVLFRYTRVIPVDFDVFVAAVDVSRTIQYMSDYIGGVIVPVEHDDQGRVVRQAERNLYLPQPNYLAVAHAEPIDVAKLETVEYGDDLHRLYWKTVESPNASALYDDGIATFARAGSRTQVTILGRQRFVLPPLLQPVHLDLAPELKAHLITDAYQTFFDRTVANLEALVEGREIRIGKGWAEPVSPVDTEPFPSAAIERWIATLVEGLSRVRTSLPPSAGKADGRRRNGGRPVRVDEEGFVHFEAPSPQIGRDEPHRLHRERTSILSDLVGFWTGLFEAAARDGRFMPKRRHA